MTFFCTHILIRSPFKNGSPPGASSPNSPTKSFTFPCSSQHPLSSLAGPIVLSASISQSVYHLINTAFCIDNQASKGSKATHLSGMFVHRLLILQQLLDLIRLRYIRSLLHRRPRPHPFLPFLEIGEFIDIDACPAS